MTTELRPSSLTPWALMFLTGSAMLAFISLAEAGSEQALDACLLVTAEDAAKAFGAPAKADRRSTDNRCHYTSSRNGQEQIAVEIDTTSGRDRKGYFQKASQRSTVTQLTGIGDGAFVFDSPAGFANVTFLKGDALVTIGYVGQNRSRSETTKHLATLAADRLGSGKAGATPLDDPALLQGHWIAYIDDGHTGDYAVRLLDVTAAGEWTLRVAPEFSGYLGAEKGRWALGGVRGTLMEGGYTVTGPDGFKTTGRITAEWSRIPTTRKAARVDYPLVSGMLIRTALGAGARQQAALDEHLVGIWEGQGEKDGQPVEVVMAVYPNGYTGIVVVPRYEGKLQRGTGMVNMISPRSPQYGATVLINRNGSFRTTDRTGTVAWAPKTVSSLKTEPTNFGDPRQKSRHRTGK